MTSAIQIFEYMFTKLWDMVFSLSITSFVTLGWIFVAIFIFRILIQWLIAVPTTYNGTRDRSSFVVENNGDVSTRKRVNGGLFK